MINIKRFKKFLQKELLLLSFPYKNIYSSLQSLAHNDKKRMKTWQKYQVLFTSQQILMIQE